MIDRTELQTALTQVVQGMPGRLIFSKPSKGNPYRRTEILQKKAGYQIACYTEKQVFHENITPEELLTKLTEQMEQFGQLNAWNDGFEFMVMVSAKGKVHYKKKQLQISGKNGQTAVGAQMESHNRKKQYLLEEGTIIPPLVDMGVFTREGKVVRSMYDKFRQINRFLELIEDELSKKQRDHLTVIDFGCGKSYLTFVLYYYLTEVKQLSVQMIGLDLKADVIAKCNQAAEKYGYDGLRFELGDINGYQTDVPVDMVVTLHACDTATDYALYNAICWNAELIFSVPCCQHELNEQMKAEHLGLYTRYGIVKERMAALTTDAIRGNLLECCGYKTQLLEFIDFAHTPKNILIRSVKRPMSVASVAKKMQQEAEAVMEEFHVKPTLYQLLKEDGRLQ
ncbi:MAG: SAM-dependent methyltransferase [Lachnospiraceae bacterium]|nr:SAM-dependent methyltransferase [Lachnospiraceae bacterium]